METRERILSVAYQLFYREGFHAIGVDRIARDAEVSRQTLYNHFETKDNILLEVVRRRDQRWRLAFEQEIKKRGGVDPIAQLRSVFDVLHEWFSAQEFNGCIFISAASEFPDPKNPAHRAAKANIDAIHGIISSVASSAGIEKPDEFASELCIAIQGAIVMEVVNRDCQTATRAAALGDALIERATRDR